MPDLPAHAEREPLRPAAAGWVCSVRVDAGQWGPCGGRPTVTAVWTSPRDGERRQAFACAVHADRFAGPEWRDVGPLDYAAATELADRRERWQAAFDGKGWRPPAPMEPRWCRQAQFPRADRRLPGSRRPHRLSGGARPAPADRSNLTPERMLRGRRPRRPRSGDASPHRHDARTREPDAALSDAPTREPTGRWARDRTRACLRCRSLCRRHRGAVRGANWCATIAVANVRCPARCHWYRWLWTVRTAPTSLILRQVVGSSPTPCCPTSGEGPLAAGSV